MPHDRHPAIPEQTLPSAQLAPTAALVADRVTKRVALAEQSLTILEEVSFTIFAAERVAITGESGSGKSTLLSLLAGLDVATEGDVVLAGVPLKQLSEDRRAQLRQQKVGFVFQSFQLMPSLTALENVMLPLELSPRAEDRRAARARATEILQRVGLDHRLAHFPRQLSGGEQQRVAIARAHVAAPAILFADEPTGNLDTVTGEKVIELLFELNRERGTTLVLVTHDRQLAARCDRRLQLSAGKLLTEALVK